MKGHTVAIRDAILAALRESWPKAMTTAEIQDAIVGDGLTGDYPKIYTNLRALNGLGSVNHWPQAEDGLREARWAISATLLENRTDVNQLEDLWEYPIPESEPPNDRSTTDE